MDDQSQNIAANQSECPSLCRSGCGFFGSPAYQGLCSKCHRDYEERKATQNSTCLATTSSSSRSSQDTQPVDLSESINSEKTQTENVDSPVCNGEGSSSTTTTEATQPDDLTATSPPTKLPKRNRCFTCRKKVGLTGFECRCGNLFCSLHRYADKHDCSFDYKRMGREEIQKRNPKVVADKIERI